MQILLTLQEENEWCNCSISFHFIWANYLLPNSPYCMINLWWETERENWSWSFLGVKGLKLLISKVDSRLDRARLTSFWCFLGEMSRWRKRVSAGHFAFSVPGTVYEVLCERLWCDRSLVTSSVSCDVSWFARCHFHTALRFTSFLLRLASFYL